MILRSLLLLLAAPLAGCADYALENKSSEDAESDEGGDVGDSDDADTGLEEPVPDGWFPDATYGLAAGVPVADGASLSVVYADSTSGDIACSAALDPAGLVAGESPDEAIWAWWEGPVTTLDSACEGLPDTLGLGIGELHPDVRARVGADGLDDVADSLFGAYVRVNGEDLWAFGYAGTAADLAGDDPAASPPPDGTYTLTALYLLPLLDAE